MTVYCPNCPGLVMPINGYEYDWKDNKPISYILELKCGKCNTILKISIPIHYYEAGVLCP